VMRSLFVHDSIQVLSTCDEIGLFLLLCLTSLIFVHCQNRLHSASRYTNQYEPKSSMRRLMSLPKTIIIPFPQLPLHHPDTYAPFAVSSVNTIECHFLMGLHHTQMENYMLP
jgi:hypothetical protein